MGNAAVKIGVTGHRLLAEKNKLSEGIEWALGETLRAFSTTHLVVISSLAEGADRLVVQHVLDREESELIVPLPCPVEQYEADFKTDESKQEFHALLQRAKEVLVMPATENRQAAYEAAGQFVLRNSEVLLTVWDGRESQGRGGTGQIVAEARRLKLPIAWVHAGNREPGTDNPRSLGDEQGMVTFENFDQLSS